MIREAGSTRTRRMLTGLEGLEGVISIVDDIFCRTQKERDHRLDGVVVRLTMARITLNRQMWIFRKPTDVC